MNTMDGKSIQAPQETPGIFRFIRQKYEPAAGRLDASVVMTSEEIMVQVSKHTGAEIRLEDVYQFMESEGFVYDSIGDMHFEWLLKEQTW